MGEINKKSGTDPLARLAFALSTVSMFFGGLAWSGVCRKSTWSPRAIQFWLGYLVILPLIAYAPSWDIPRIIDHLPWFSSTGLGAFIYLHIARWVQCLLLFAGPFFAWLSSIGAWVSIKLMRYKSAIKQLGLKTAMGTEPHIVDVISYSQGQKKIIVKAVGLSLEDFTSKKAIIESSLNKIVQDIRHLENNRQIVEIRISDKDLPKLVPYDEVSTHLQEPFSFLVGEGMTGFLVGNLRVIHHLLVAGSSGGGKSFFVKQFLIGLLQSSQHIQLYLLDLKRGVEMKVFEKLENVFIAKNPVPAIEILAAVVKEMDRRFDYFETNGYTEIDCKRDQMDRIVVLVDEASELFTVVKSSKAIKASAENARELADKIAKLGRVAGIHLILATQKVVKETIDTRVQTNINARMVFRVETTASSMTVLGNKMAFELPMIGGRGIWSVGSHHIFVQTPKLDNEEVGKKVALLTEKFNGKSSPLFREMLSIKRQKTEEVAAPVPKLKQEGVDNTEGAF
jgi:S-DNA-T family DNA segregation ATPase FtsK/SpoIIIE